MSEKAATELRPCPWCGGKAELITIPADHDAPCPPENFVACDQCRFSHTCWPTDDEAIKAWNTRTDNTAKVLGEVKSEIDALPKEKVSEGEYHGDWRIRHPAVEDIIDKAIKDLTPDAK